VRDLSEALGPSRALRIAATLWLVVVACVIAYDVTLWLTGGIEIDTDILAMLPQDERNLDVTNATRQLADSGARRVVVLVGAKDWTSTKIAADAYALTLKRQAPELSISYHVDQQQTDQWLGFYTPYRDRLLTPAARFGLTQKSASTLAGEAVAALYRPVAMPRIGSWQQDPLNLYGEWLTARAAASRVRVDDGRLYVSDGERQYALLTLEQPGSAFSMTAQEQLMPVLASAASAARTSASQVEVLTIGVPLYAAAAAQQARREVDTIGVGSLVGIIILTFFAFSSLRPRILVTMSILVGLATALAGCVLLFGRLDVITLVFGASLVGVAENYATNYFSNRLGRPATERWAILRHQAPVLWLAMLTTVIGYALLALTPFPGLRQIAVFSALGLVAAFVTTLWWFPFLDRSDMASTALARWIGSRRAYWPSLGRNRFTKIFAGLTLVLLACGLFRVHFNDDIRVLQNAPPALIEAQRRIDHLLDLPTPAQFFLIEGSTEDQVLAREEALKTRLDQLILEHHLGGYQAISDWVPSLSRQQDDARLMHQKIAGAQGVRTIALQQLGEATDASMKERTSSGAFDGSAAPLTIERWLAAPVSEPFRHQWLGHFKIGFASVILLQGTGDTSSLALLGALANPSSGVVWVDKVAEISGVMQRYRSIMALILLPGYALVLLALSRRFGRRAWRALAPTALASLLALALLALLGQPLQLFNVLALLLILGMGVDYGIFMLESPGRHEPRPFLSITLAAASTLLAFGLLALSGTPALRAFGLTMLLGITLAWLLTPVFMPEDQQSRPSGVPL
jgi:predicted exporter